MGGRRHPELVGPESAEAAQHLDEHRAGEPSVLLACQLTQPLQAEPVRPRRDVDEVAWPRPGPVPVARPRQAGRGEAGASPSGWWGRWSEPSEQSEQHDRTLIGAEVSMQPDRGRVLAALPPGDPQRLARGAGQEDGALADGAVVRSSPPPHCPGPRRCGELDRLGAPGAGDASELAIVLDDGDDPAETATLLDLSENVAIGISQEAGRPPSMLVRFDAPDAAAIDQPDTAWIRVPLARPPVDDDDRRVCQRSARRSPAIDQRLVEARDGLVDQLEARNRERPWIAIAHVSPAVRDARKIRGAHRRAALRASAPPNITAFAAEVGLACWPCASSRGLAGRRRRSRPMHHRPG